ncbi:amidase [Mycolicibacter algericus]|uniref:amidase n=2 Tax=Mycolicibacter algericus TaxID=1288388 RepID=A0A7I9YAR8_MYCAL|nr:amidase [Mycolicibacter algericus]OQZ95160.1 amidase [Mycolicibacter algericus DSM 45454]GFG85809.1 putative amidase [Mycolicibacter algericus]
MTHPTELTALQLVAAYTSGELSPVEATAAALSVINERDGEVNAFCLVDEEAALSAARKSEARWSGNYTKGLLDGVPVAVKDVFRTAGWPTLRGSLLSDAAGPWPDDSPAVGKMRDDGMVLLGKTTTPELAWKGVTDSPRTGITRNPVDITRTAGGSSGGSAAAVGAGMAPLAIGTDGGGSIRIPAAFCGVVGFKPTHGRVPMYPISPFGPLAHAGPITRTVEDAAMLLDIIALPDHRDPTSLAPTLTTYRGEVRRDVVGLGVAYSPNLGYADVDPQIEAAVGAAVRALADAGLNVTEADPGFADPIDAFEVLWATGAAGSLRGHEADRGLVDPGLAEMWERGQAASAVDYLAARQVSVELGLVMGRFHERHNLLITPTTPIPAFAAGHDVPADSGMRWWAQWTPFTYPFNMTQQPALSIPIGTTSEGLPIGMQIIGPRHSDDLVLAAGLFAERVLGL